LLQISHAQCGPEVISLLFCRKSGSVLYPQLLGLCMGIEEKTLGISINQLDISGVKSFFDSGVENAE